MAETKLRTKFQIEGQQQTKWVMIPANLLVAEVIEMMKVRFNIPDFNRILLDGAELDLQELFECFHDPNATYTLSVSPRSPPTGTETADEGVKQVVFVCFDESGSMNYTMDGYEYRAGEQPKLAIAKQYVSTFAKKVGGSCVLGLISFNDEVTTRCPLGRSAEEFEAGMKMITPESTTHLWDALDKAADGLVELACHAGRKKKEFENARLRILVISDGDDVGSSARPWAVLEKLCKYDIVLDSVIVSSEDSCKKLNALSHMTGGMSCRPANVEEGLSLFEQEAFLFLDGRKTNDKYHGVFNQAALKNRTRSVEFDKVYTQSEVAEMIDTPAGVSGGHSLSETVTGLYLA